MRFAICVGFLTSACLLSFCVSDDSVNGPDASSDGTTSDVVSTNDAGADAPPPAQGFTLSLSPGHVTADPGDSNVAITIDVSRAVSFTDDVSFTVTPPAHVTATSPADTGNGGNSSSFAISVDNAATNGDISVTVSGQNPAKTFVETATLGIHVGSLLDIGDGGFTLPSYASGIVVKAWGAGGGGGSGCTDCQASAPMAGLAGGGGGFATGTFPLASGTNLSAVAGSGGVGGTWQVVTYDYGGGGGGGGFTSIKVNGASTYLLVAGGGGGGVSAPGNTIALTTAIGGAGGGTTGQDGKGECGGNGGTQTQGGAGCDAGTWSGGSGAAQQGGSAYSSLDAGAHGGNPGGGFGGQAAIGTNAPGSGGGGGGYFGGGGGGGSGLAIGSGGGGSGWFNGDAGALMTGSGAAAANTSDPDYAHCAANAGVGGAAGASNGGTGGMGNPGCVVVRLAKP